MAASYGADMNKLTDGQLMIMAKTMNYPFNEYKAEMNELSAHEQQEVYTQFIRAQLTNPWRNI